MRIGSLHCRHRHFGGAVGRSRYCLGGGRAKSDIGSDILASPRAGGCRDWAEPVCLAAAGASRGSLPGLRQAPPAPSAIWNGRGPVGPVGLERALGQSADFLCDTVSSTLDLRFPCPAPPRLRQALIDGTLPRSSIISLSSTTRPLQRFVIQQAERPSDPACLLGCSSQLPTRNAFAAAT